MCTYIRSDLMTLLPLHELGATLVVDNGLVGTLCEITIEPVTYLVTEPALY